VVLANEPHQTQSLLLLARTYRNQGLTAQAVDSYRRLLEQVPDQEEALSELTTLVIEQRDFQTAEELLRSRLEADPGDIQAASLLIEVLITQDKLTDAEERSRRLMGTDEGLTVGAFQLGRILQAQRKYPESVDAYRVALDGAPNSAVALEGLVFSLIRSGDVEEAKEILESKIAQDPGEIASRYLLGNILAEEGDAQAARALYEEVLVRTPQFANGYLAVARTYTGNPDSQAAVYRRGLAAIPGNAELGILLGTIYEESAEYEQAIALYDQVLEANPDAAFIRNNLAATLLDRREDAASYERALELARGFAQNRNPVFLDTLGWAHYRAGDAENAVRYLERAVANEQAATTSIVHYHLGMAYAASDNIVGARQELTRALEMGEFEWSEQARSALSALN